MAGMTAAEEYRLYQDLAPWWPLISPPEEYAEEAASVGDVLGAVPGPMRELLDLGCGGGHLAVHLKDQFTLTLIDISPDMLAVCAELNPECDQLRADMRTVRLDREFDGILVLEVVD